MGLKSSSCNLNVVIKINKIKMIQSTLLCYSLLPRSKGNVYQELKVSTKSRGTKSNLALVFQDLCLETLCTRLGKVLRLLLSK